MSEIIQSIIQRVKNRLEITGELSSIELYNQLFEYRTNFHPDRFLDNDQKDEAEERFKEVSSLLNELERFIKDEKLAKKPGELIPLKEVYETITIKQSTINLEEKIKDLENRLRYRDDELKELRQQLRLSQNEKLSSITQELIDQYKPTKKSLLALGIAFVLTLVLGAVSRVDQIASIITKYSPVNRNIFNSVVFAILIFIPFAYLKKLYKERVIERMAKKIRTPFFISGFLEYLEELHSEKEFTELTVYNYLSLKFTPKTGFSNFLYSKILATHTDSTIDSLKDIFVYNLISKKLINVAHAKMLDRSFRIINHPNYYHPGYDMEF